MQWISVKDGFPELGELVLCLGFKQSPERKDTAQYEVMSRIYLHKPDLMDSKGNPVRYGWSKRWWDTNPDLYSIFYWARLEPPKP